MNRLVYLFELDSVIKCDHNLNGVAFTKGVQALFCEVINRGNSVAITMNQLTDSQFIRESIRDDMAYSCILRLFEYGALKVSLYNNIRTASQYIQQAIKKCLDSNNDSFVFSNLPVKKDEKPLLETIQNALQFSDLSLLKEMISNAEGQEKERLRMVYRFVYMILQISVCETSNIPPKTTAKRTFEQFLKIITDKIDNNYFSGKLFEDDIKKANEILKARSEQITDGRNNRSNWLDEFATESSAELANIIINLCYNYTVEDSINGVSKHYDDLNFEETFVTDFANRLELYFADKQSPQTSDISIVSKSDFDAIIRFAKYKANSANKVDFVPPVYEQNFFKEKQKWIWYILFKNMRALFISFIYICIFLVVELGLSIIENAFSIPISNAFVSSVLALLLFGILGSLIGKILSLFNHKQNIPDVLECLVDIWFRFCDFLRVLGDKNDSYKLP